MGFLDSVKAWFKTEAAQARDIGQKTQSRMSADLDRREAELNATPQQRLEQLQDKMAGNDSSFDDIQSKIEGREILADATNEVADIDQPAGPDSSNPEDLLDLESEEIIPPEQPNT